MYKLKKLFYVSKQSVANSEANTEKVSRESQRGSTCMHTRVAIAVRSNGLLRVSCKTVFPPRLSRSRRVAACKPHPGTVIPHRQRIRISLQASKNACPRRIRPAKVHQGAQRLVKRTPDAEIYACFEDNQFG